MTKKPPKNKRNEAYWQSREQAEKDYMINNLKSDDAFNQILQARYNHTANELSDKITAELSRLSDKNGLSYAEAQKAVRSADMKRLGNEAKLIVQKARATGNKELTKEVADRLRLYNATMRINRLEMLKAKIGQEMTDLGIDLTQDLQKRLASDYQAEVKRQAGLMSNSVASTNSLATTAVLKHVYGQTGGANFSNRVWHNMDVLKSRLDMEMSNVIMTGKNIQDVAKELRPLVNKHVNNVRYATERVARTESARIQNEAKLDALNRNGYKFCKWHAEPKACPECAQIARQDNGWGAGVYKVSDVPYLPAHPNCRCSLSAYWVDEETLSTIKSYSSIIPEKVGGTHGSLPVKSSSLDVKAKVVNGKVVQYRMYNKQGKAATDIDMTNHGNAKHHPIVPHSHQYQYKNGIITGRTTGNKLTKQEERYLKKWGENNGTTNERTERSD